MPATMLDRADGCPDGVQDSLPSGARTPVAASAWTVEGVVAHFKSEGLESAAKFAKDQEVDGEAFGLFSLEELITYFDIKAGPAKKLASLFNGAGPVPSTSKTFRTTPQTSISEHFPVSSPASTPEPFSPSSQQSRSRNVGPVLLGERARDISPQQSSLDYTVLLGAERTLYAGQQMAWNIIFVGMALMLVSAKDGTPGTCGIASIIAGMLLVLGSWVLHMKRLRRIIERKQPRWLWSLTWSLATTLTFISAVTLELFYAVSTPYLLRSKIVEVQ